MSDECFSLHVGYYHNYTGIFRGDVGNFTTNEVCDLLNRLSYENDKLKESVNTLKATIDISEVIVDELKRENEELKAQLGCNGHVCSSCKYQYLVHQDNGFYIEKCRKGYDKCSKDCVVYCEDFKLNKDKKW